MFSTCAESLDALPRLDIRGIRPPDERFTLLSVLVTGRAIPITWTPCHFGGRRPWWVCPRCGDRVAVLYQRRYEWGALWACRVCLGLLYRTQQLHRADRAFRKARRIRLGLGGTASLLDPFPPKPKWMRWHTYARLRDSCTAAHWVAVAPDIRWLDRMGMWPPRA